MGTSALNIICLFKAIHENLGFHFKGPSLTLSSHSPELSAPLHGYINQNYDYLIFFFKNSLLNEHKNKNNNKSFGSSLEMYALI